MKIRQAVKVVGKCSLVKLEGGSIGIESNGQRSRTMRLAVGCALRHHCRFRKKPRTIASALNLWLGPGILMVSKSTKKHASIFDLSKFKRKRIKQKEANQ